MGIQILSLNHNCKSFEPVCHQVEILRIICNYPLHKSVSQNTDNQTIYVQTIRKATNDLENNAANICKYMQMICR